MDDDRNDLSINCSIIVPIYSSRYTLYIRILNNGYIRGGRIQDNYTGGTWQLSWLGTGKLK